MLGLESKENNLLTSEQYLKDIINKLDNSSNIDNVDIRHVLFNKSNDIDSDSILCANKENTNNYIKLEGDNDSYYTYSDINTLDYELATIRNVNSCL